jgi:hypothetical protein
MLPLEATKNLFTSRVLILAASAAIATCSPVLEKAVTGSSPLSRRDAWTVLIALSGYASTLLLRYSEDDTHEFYTPKGLPGRNKQF